MTTAARTSGKCYTNLPRIDPSPFNGPANPLPSPCTSLALAPVRSVIVDVDVDVELLIVAGFRTGSSKGRLIMDLSDSERLKRDEVYEWNWRRTCGRNGGRAGRRRVEVDDGR